ncbi:hypothetical protein [Flectobacillus rivi]|uniref:Uncharacterized protein n=1 Tax=Flectobacillus rivi TaxID=2984209 RepID=A0ABT6YZN9_9BACT|nr:hypothetical protein [Flectobacillus rivi]MDI9874270.1 hypothetical protein [Flectobacillus rivi]
MGSYLAEHGFKIRQDCTICKSEKDLVWTVRLTFNTYDTIHLKSISCRIKEVSLEKASIDVLYGHLSKEQINDSLKQAVTLYGPFKVVGVDIYHDEQIHLFAIAFKDFFEKEMLPFFYKYSEIQSLNIKYQEYDLEYKEGVGYIGSFHEFAMSRNFLGFFFQDDSVSRRALTMKFSHDPKVNDFIKWYQSCIESGQVGLESSKDYYLEVVQKLINWEVPEKYLK